MSLSNLPVLLWNWEDGGIPAGGGGGADRDAAGLHRALREVPKVPGLVVINEAKDCRRRGQRGARQIARELRGLFGAPYIPLLGWLDRGDFPPCLFYDPTRLEAGEFHDPLVADANTYEDWRNVARFTAINTGCELVVAPQHWHPRDGAKRLAEAEAYERWGWYPQPAMVCGDLNSTASGPDLPDPGWETVEHKLRLGKGRQLPDGTWTADTDALDRLLGAWTPQGRVGGVGFAAVCELAAATGTPPQRAFAPTTGPRGSRMLIDWQLCNRALADRYERGSYVVLAGDEPFPSDHYPVYAEYDLS